MSPKKIIIDTDPGVDDVLAILLALASPEVEVVGITITFGNTHADMAYSNLLKIYASLAREVEADPSALDRYPALKAAKEQGKKTVLALGVDEPVGGTKSTAAYFHGEDGLSNISTSHPHFTPPPLLQGELHEYLDISMKPAHEVILDLLASEPEGSVTIVALGPVGNLSLAIDKDPETFGKVREVVWMGGALDVPGNTTPSAEFNSFADPYAAQNLLDAVERNLFPLSMAPLDLTTPHTIDFDKLVHDLEVPDRKSPVTPLQEFTTAMLIRVRGLMKAFQLEDAMEMHDPVAVWYAISSGVTTEDPINGVLGEQDGWDVQHRLFKIERTGEYTRGMCVVDRRGTGEESFTRTKGGASDGKTVAGNKDKVGENGAQQTKGTPRIITKTPGSAALEKMLLSRVFGT